MRTLATLLLLATSLQAASPVNQVFQFMQSGSYSGWADGATTQATAYLWIPEKCRRLRGLLVMGSNVPEHMLVGHPAIREVCAKNDLGIVWSTPSFWYHKARNEDSHVVAFLQQLLDGLARTSGYEEVAIVPWIPMGESGHLLMVDALVEAAPQRCLAGIWIKNAHLPPKNRTVPALVVYGTAQEWGQDKVDIRQRWNTLTSYDNVLKQRKANPNWPLSFVIDGGSGHFDVSERLVRYFAHYIDQAVKPKRPKGVIEGLPLPNRTEKALWFHDAWLAKEAQAIAAIDWQAQSQLPAFETAAGTIAPFDFNGISSITPRMEPDGITFRLRPVLLDKLPANFVGAGETLAKAPAAPTLEWLCGPLAPAGDGMFRVALDRTWPHHPIYLAARESGAAGIRAAVQPIAIKLARNNEGMPQKIDFQPLPDVKTGTAAIALEARSDSGLPVQFFVVAGPAIVEGGKLLFTAIPPRSRLPLQVTVAAWQWGRAAEPKVKAADIVRQSLQIQAR